MTGGHLRTRHLRGLLLAVVACIALAAASPALAATWDVYRLPGGPVTGHVTKTSATRFTVTNARDVKVGSVVKTSTGAWKVMKGKTSIASARANGTRAYPVNLYDARGAKIARCGLVDGAWRVERDFGFVKSILASVPKGCPARAAAGAVRLVDWR